MPSRTKSSKAPPSSEPLDDLAAEPPTEDIDPYEVLSVARDATDDQIKKAYRKAALKHHPDKASGPHAATAHADFQRIAFAYSILSSPSRRSHYDLTGSTSTSHLSSDSDSEAFDWSTFFRSLYAEISLTEVAAFSSKYKHSAEERADLLREFEGAKGNMDRVYESVMLSDVLADDDRFRGILDEAIKGGEVEGWERYTNETEKSKEARVRRAEKEAKMAEKEKTKQEAAAKEKGSKKGGGDDGQDANGEAGLLALIQGRQKERGASFLDRLEAKYKDEEEQKKSGKKATGGRKAAAAGKKRKQADDDDREVPAVDEPPEEAFAAMQERMQEGRKRRK